MNKIIMFINGVDYTKNIVFPVKWGDLLDERLDEVRLTLKNLTQEQPFAPLTRVEIGFINEPECKVAEIKTNRYGDLVLTQNYDAQTHKLQQILDRRYIVANDTVNNYPVGSKFWVHELYLIEETKLLEGFICDSISFTNPLGNNCGERFKASAKSTVEVLNNGVSDKFSNVWTSSTFPGAWGTGEPFTIPIADEVGKNEKNCPYGKTFFDLSNYTKKFVGITDSAGNNVEITDGKVKLRKQLYTVRYQFSHNETLANVQYYVDIDYTLSGFENKYPLKKWTITDVINRCLELAEPLRATENPRFVLDGVKYSNGEIVNYKENHRYRQGSLAEKYEKIIAPEFAMTKQNLREQLKQVGGFIHAEPRLRDGVIYFDEYGSNTISDISKKKYISCQTSWDINEYCTSLDSQADNLINRLDYAQGVVIEPFANAFQTLRTETTTVRLDENDSNARVRTSRPIMAINKVLVRYVTDITGSGANEVYTWSKAIDITAHLFESAEYKNLSSFSGAFPYAKEYALTYTQGQKDITGLFYKSPDALGETFQRYSIVKIINSNGGSFGGTKKAEYPMLSFQVSYIPIFNERVKTNKAIRIGGMPRNIAYNQSASLVEVRYYGENLKGTVARLGNIEKTYTYKVAFLTDIPKVGDLFDKHYYISAVYVEYQAYFIKVTVGLSKDFNRLSEYVGISSNLRLYEVSEKQAFNRDTVLNDYLLITDNNKPVSLKNELNSNSPMALQSFRNAIKRMFDNSSVAHSQITQAIIRGRDIKNNEVTSYDISLPVISSALGNQMTFSFNCEDNYSAGQKVVYQEVNGVYGRYGQFVPYCDYYGRIYYLSFSLFCQPRDGLQGDETYQNYIEHKFPISSPQFDRSKLDPFIVEDHVYSIIKYRKDSREVSSFTYQINIVADVDQDDYVIGSGFARNCSLVNGQPITDEDGNTVALKVYIFDKRLSLYDKLIDIESAKEVIDMPNISLDVEDKVTPCNLVFKNIVPKVNGKSWAIVTPKKVDKIKVEDEEGRVTEQEIITGQELILGKNVDITAYQEIVMPKFCFVHDIYEREYLWKTE